MIYHQNIQLSMKQEALAHLLSQLSGRFFHCKARWNNSRSMYCNTLKMHQPHERAIHKMMPTVKIFFCSLQGGGRRKMERVYIYIFVCVCVCERDWKDACTEGDRGFTAEIKMESILVLEAHSSTVWGPAWCVSLPLLFQSLPLFPPLLCFNCSAFLSLHCLYNFLLSSIVTPLSFPFLSSSLLLLSSSHFSSL